VVLEKPKKSRPKKETKEPMTLELVEAKIKQLVEKYKFMIENASEMRVSEVLEMLLHKIPHVDVKEMITNLIEQVKNFGIGGLLVNSLDNEE
jgi:threonine synthase